MKKLYPRYFILLFSLILFCIAIPFEFMKTEYMAAEGKVIYTAATGGTSENAGNGTLNNPYNLFDTALKNASDGDTICILEPMAFLNAADNSPYVIDKAVTIKGDGNLFLIRSAGLVLGADVTFENVVLSFGNRYHDAVFANGHALTLKNVSCEEGGRQVDIFGGGLYMNGKSVAQSGNAAQIIMTGGGENFGNVYAGAMNGVYTGNVTISLTNLKSAGNMVINASGADETYVNVDDFFNLEEPAPPTANKNYTISGNVNIVVDNCNISKIEQISPAASAACNLTINTNGQYNGLIAALNMDLITVKGGGTFAPTAMTDGTAVTLTDGSSMSLINISQPVISNLVSQNSSQNRLILEKEQFVTITNSLKGSFVFETDNGYNGYSGTAQYDFAYIRLTSGAAVNNASISFTCIPGMEMTMDKITNYTVSGKTYSAVWKTSEGGEYRPFAISGLEITNPTVITTVSGFYNSSVFDASVTVPESVENDYYFDLVPIRYEVTYNNKKYTAEAEFDGISYIANVPELRLSFFAFSEADLSNAGICVYMYMDGSDNTPEPPATGSYEINILPLSSGEQISETVHLIIVDDSEYEAGSVTVKDTVTKLSLSASSAAINDKITVTATVKNSDGTNALNASTTLYINGQEYKGAKNITSGGAVSYTLNTTQENGFVIGTNDICILYSGAADGKTASGLSHGNATLAVKQASVKMSYSAQNQTYKYTGLPVKYSAGTVRITDSSNNVLQDKITPEIYYKQNGSRVTPIEPGTYEVFYSVTGNLYGTIEQKAATLTIQSATPQITLTGSVSSGNKIKLQAVVNGVSSSFVPVGTIKFYMDGSSMGQVNLSYGEAALSKQLKPGTYTFTAGYEPVYSNKTPYYTAIQSSKITVVVKESGTEITTEKNTEPETKVNDKDEPTTDSEENPADNSATEEYTEENFTTEDSTEDNFITEDDTEESFTTEACTENILTTEDETERNSVTENITGNTSDDETEENKISKYIVPIIGAVVILAVTAVGCVFYIRKKKEKENKE